MAVIWILVLVVLLLVNLAIAIDADDRGDKGLSTFSFFTSALLSVAIVMQAVNI